MFESINNREEQFKKQQASKRDLEKFNYIMSINDFLGIYADQNFGYMPELNLQMISDFINSDKFIAYSFSKNLSEKEEVFKMLEQELLDGFPIWRFFILSDWTIQMQEKSFSKEIENERAKILCYKCKNYKVHESSFGTAEKCLYLNEVNRYGRREPLEVRTECEFLDKDVPVRKRGGRFK